MLISGADSVQLDMTSMSSYDGESFHVQQERDAFELEVRHYQGLGDKEMWAMSTPWG